MPKISVLLTVFNKEDYVRESIVSVLKQSLTDFELLIGENCSTDNSRIIIEGFSDERIKNYFNEIDLGLFGNLNKLIACASTPLIYFLNADDVLESNCLEEEVCFFGKYPNVAMSFCKDYAINEKGMVVGKAALGDLPEIIQPRLGTQLLFYYGSIPGCQSTVCIRKKCFEAIGLFNETFKSVSDYEMYIRICRQFDIGVIHKHLVRSRKHAKQLSRSSVAGVEFIQMHRKIAATLLYELPKEVQSRAKWYFKCHHNVLDVHYCIKCFFSFRFKDFLNIICIIGPVDFIIGVFFWILTLDNRLYRPKPKIIE